MPQYIEKAEKMTLPLITLRDTVAFPGALLNFELTDESDIRAAKAASATSGLVFLVTEKPRQLAEQLVDLIFSDEDQSPIGYLRSASPEQLEQIKLIPNIIVDPSVDDFTPAWYC